jgi:hypothetical protein
VPQEVGELFVYFQRQLETGVYGKPETSGFIWPPQEVDGTTWTTRWAKIPVPKKMAIIATLNKAAPWLQAFQDSWAAIWLLDKAINQRVSDG